jgi:hypothetical protein
MEKFQYWVAQTFAVVVYNPEFWFVQYVPFALGTFGAN